MLQIAHVSFKCPGSCCFKDVCHKSTEMRLPERSISFHGTLNNIDRQYLVLTVMLQLFKGKLLHIGIVNSQPC